MEAFKELLLTNLSQLDGFAAYSAIVGLLLICGLGVPLPEDITLIAAGILASPAVGSISLPGAMIAGFFGVMIGDASQPGVLSEIRFGFQCEPMKRLACAASPLCRRKLSCTNPEIRC